MKTGNFHRAPEHWKVQALERMKTGNFHRTLEHWKVQMLVEALRG